MTLDMTLVRLPVINEVGGTDAVVVNRRAGPMIIGRDDESLTCGGCDEVIAQGVAQSTFHARFHSVNRLLLECNSCGARNLVPSQRLAAA